MWIIYHLVGKVSLFMLRLLSWSSTMKSFTRFRLDSIWLAHFQNSIQVTGGPEDCYLIATSEQPICAFHQNETFENNDNLPLR